MKKIDFYSLAVKYGFVTKEQVEDLIDLKLVREVMKNPKPMPLEQVKEKLGL